MRDGGRPAPGWRPPPAPGGAASALARPYLLDDSRQLLWLLEGCEMSAGHHADIESLVSQTFPGLDDLVWLERVSFAAHDVEGHRVS